MNKPLLLAAIFLLCQTAFAQIITVKQDSTGDYIYIQDAVDMANIGDTVLVWPGTFYENVEIEEKYLTLGSLALTTGDDTYINRTIINGNQTGSCIKLNECQDTCIVNGFTLTNGSGTWNGSIMGGGIFAEESEIKLFNCRVHNNRVTGIGGGIFIYKCYLFLSGSTISNNHAMESAGGIGFVINSTLVFDSVKKCNIYENYAAEGTDINKGKSSAPVHIIVDTFTVAVPDYYYLFSSNDDDYNEGITFDINTGKIEQVAQNLFVSNTGNNANSGLTLSEPLKDIHFALLKMKSDSVSPDTIHIANGMYSPSSGEKFPLSIKKYVSLQGESRDSCIFDGEQLSYHLHGLPLAKNFKISQLTIQNGKESGSSPYIGSFVFYRNNHATYEDLVFRQNFGYASNSGTISISNSVLFKNVDFISNTGGATFRAFSYYETDNVSDTIRLSNCRFIENLPDYTDPEYGVGGGPFIAGPGGLYPTYMTCIFNNCLFTDNRTKDHPLGGATSISLGVSSGAQVHLANCTFSDNYSDNWLGANIGVTYGSKLNVYNSIMYDNDLGEIYMWTSEGEGDSYLEVYNSLVDGGEEDIHIFSDGNHIFYDETNIDEDPNFLGKWEHPYQINTGSPCIDAGTLNLPDFIEIPEFDLAGNPRVIGDSIDMGAYEWNPTVGIDKYQYQPIESEQPKLLKAAPNPFRMETTISADWDFQGHVQIEIYNNSGLRVKQIKSGQSYRTGSLITPWDGKGQNGNEMPSGIYHLVMTWDGKEVENLKIIHH